MPIAVPLAVTFDCHDPTRLAEFWCALVGGNLESEPHDHDYIVIENVPVFGHLGFQQVPEDKVVKNRVHLDLDVADIEAAVVASTAIGAVRFGVPVEEPWNWFQVMRDPEGNEFCFIRRKETVDP
jgi:predicted enzyme related to lactoylglutathione lyase